MSNKYTILSSPIKVGNVELKNRIMTSGHQTTLPQNHFPTKEFAAYHLERAKGGCGLIVVEAHGAHRTSFNIPTKIDSTNPEIVDFYQELTKEIKEYGTSIIAQIMHNGSSAFLSDRLSEVVSASDTPSDRFYVVPRELEEEEIEEIIEGFVVSAKNLKDGGFDGIELTGSHNYLFAQFWNPRTNTRKDQWGGTFENRLRFASETIKRVRSIVGTDFVVGMRISLESKDDVGTTFEESFEIIKYLNEMGLLDYWSLVIGSSSTHTGSSYIAPISPVTADDLFKNVKKVKDLIAPAPLIVTTRVHHPDIAEKLLGQGICDIVGMTRALIADPYMPKKAFEDDLSSIIPCIGCNQGCIGRFVENLPIRCTVNPKTGREYLMSSIEQATQVKHVLVVGGGPAGMMAAITANSRGHHVTLIEKEQELGGQLNVIKGALNREQLDQWNDYLKRQIEHSKIELFLGQKFDSHFIEDKKIDTIIIATGSKPIIPRGSDNTKYPVYTSWEILQGVSVKEENIIVIDWKGDWSGVEAADLLASNQKQVEIISATNVVGEALQSSIRYKFLKRFDHYGTALKQTPYFKLKELKEEELVIQNLFSERYETRKPQALVLAVGTESREATDLYRDLKKDYDVIRIGDALSPRSLNEAVWEGFKIGIDI